MYIVNYIWASVFFSWNLLKAEHSCHGSLVLQDPELSTPQKNTSTSTMFRGDPVQNTSRRGGSFVEPWSEYCFNCLIYLLTLLYIYLLIASINLQWVHSRCIQKARKQNHYVLKCLKQVILHLGTCRWGSCSWFITHVKLSLEQS